MGGHAQFLRIWVARPQFLVDLSKRMVGFVNHY